MDKRLEQALDFANYRATIANQKTNLKNRIATLKVCHYGGSQFTANKTNIAYIRTLIDLGYKEAVVEDDKNNPIEVTDLQALLDDLTSANHAAMNEYLMEHKKINKARGLKTMMDW
tara:strand:- start:20949 stop:21296 length:348 start_codon:yes stop_codon:yes gene_type:complete